MVAKSIKLVAIVARMAGPFVTRNQSFRDLLVVVITSSMAIVVTFTKLHLESFVVEEALFTDFTVVVKVGFMPSLVIKVFIVD